jgi:hypothetical protein
MGVELDRTGEFLSQFFRFHKIPKIICANLFTIELTEN